MQACTAYGGHPPHRTPPMERTLVNRVGIPSWLNSSWLRLSLLKDNSTRPPRRRDGLRFAGLELLAGIAHRLPHIHLHSICGSATRIRILRRPDVFVHLLALPVQTLIVPYVEVAQPLHTHHPETTADLHGEEQGLSLPKDNLRVVETVANGLSSAVRSTLERHRAAAIQKYGPAGIRTRDRRLGKPVTHPV